MHEILDQRHIGLTQIQILTASASSRNHYCIQTVQHSGRDIAAVHYPHLHILIQTESRHSLADTGNGTSVPLKHSYFYLLIISATARHQHHGSHYCE